MPAIESGGGMLACSTWLGSKLNEAQGVLIFSFCLSQQKTIAPRPCNQIEHRGSLCADLYFGMTFKLTHVKLFTFLSLSLRCCDGYHWESSQTLHAICCFRPRYRPGGGGVLSAIRIGYHNRAAKCVLFLRLYEKDLTGIRWGARRDTVCHQPPLLKCISLNVKKAKVTLHWWRLKSVSGPSPCGFLRSLFFFFHFILLSS